MSLRYSFRHLFYGGNIHKERLYKVLKDLDEANGGDEKDISSLKETVGDSKSGLVKRTTDLETTVGNSDSGLVKKTTDLETAVGDSDSGLVKDVSEINTAIGDENTEGTILARIKYLEDHMPTTQNGDG